MKALILAAGYGTRLYPLTLNRPKPLLTVGSKTIADRIIEKIEPLDEIDKIYIVTNQKYTEAFEDWAGERRYKKEIKIIDDKTLTNETRLGAIGDIELVIREAAIRDDILIIGGDNLFEFKLEDFIKFAKSKDNTAVCLRDVGDLKAAQRYGIVRLDKNGRVTEFIEKPKMPKSTLAAMCIYYFPKEKLSLLGVYLKSGEDKDAPGHYIAWLARNDAVYGYKVCGGWFDIGDKELYKAADKFYSERRE